MIANAKLEILSAPMWPGKKCWFAPSAARFFRRRQCTTLIEPFCGSGVVGLSLLHAGIVERLVLVDADIRVVTMLNGLITHGGLAERFAAFECSKENVEALKKQEPHSAFTYLVLSRVGYFGKFDGGPRPVINERWCASTVGRNANHIYALRDRIEVAHGDALEILPRYQHEPATGAFCDPPYSASANSKGCFQYKHFKLNHPRLFALMSEWRGPWLMTQDTSLTVRRLAACYKLQTKRLGPIQTAQHKWKYELAITRRRGSYGR